MSIQHIGSGGGQVDPSQRGGHVKVLANETFKAAINGIDVVTFIKGQEHARPFQRKEVEAYLEDGRLELVDAPKAKKPEPKVEAPEEVEEEKPKAKAKKK